MIKKIALIGLGAIGASIGEQIIGKGFDFKVIAGKGRIDKYKKDEVYVNNQKISFDYITSEKGYIVDLIIVSTKFHDLNVTIKSISKFVGDKTIILSLINGIDSENIIGNFYGMDKMLHSHIINIAAVKESNRITTGNKGTIHYGDINDSKDWKIFEVKEFFDSCNISYVIEENILKSIWWKFMINVGVNQLSATTGATFGTVSKHEEARKMMNLAMKEVVELSRAKGINLTDEDMYSWYPICEKLPYNGRPSMAQDVENKRKTEVEMLAGKVIELGKELNVATPINEYLYQALKLIESRY